MKELGKRLRVLRESVGLSQAKLAQEIGSNQSSINRYENGQAAPTVELLRKYADYFDVSMDYIFARCDDPRGKLYENKIMKQRDAPELRDFIEMCFEPGSPMNERLKESLFQMMTEGKKMTAVIYARYSSDNQRENCQAQNQPGVRYLLAPQISEVGCASTVSPQNAD